MRRARREGGFALLLVFSMAAAVAILLYTEMPRVVFEAQRMREQTLIDRGEQYQRAIQLYVRKIQRYPARIEDLESTNNIRFLRRRYPDPMTGKDDWRLIHVGPGGILLDSKVQKPPVVDPSKEKDKEKKPENPFTAEAPPGGFNVVAGQTGAGPQTPLSGRRASDRAAVVAGTFGQFPGGAAVADPNNPQQVPPGYPAPGQTNPYYPGGQPAQYPGMQPGQYPGVQPGQYPTVQPGLYPGVQPGQYPGLQPGQVPPGVQPGQYPGVQPGQYPGVQPGLYPGVQPGQYPGVQPGQFPGMQPGQYPGVQPGQFPGMQPGQYPGVQPGQNPGGLPGLAVPIGQPQQGGPTPGPANPNPALDLIRNLLTSPRPGGPIGGAAQSPGMQMGGGIAGVASKFESDAIKVYNDKTTYEEWEFIYDPKKDRNLGAGMTGMIPGMQGQMGAGQQPGTFGQTPGTFGQTPGFGQGQGPGFGPQPMPQQPVFGMPQPPAGRPGTGRGR